MHYLNTINYGNSTQWALPTTVNLQSSNTYPYPPPVSSSQLAELFYTELGGTGGDAIPSNSLFSHEQADTYWSGTEYFAYPDVAWALHTNHGLQSDTGKAVHGYVWAISPGQVNAAPVPGAVWMFGTDLIGLLGLKATRSG